MAVILKELTDDGKGYARPASLVIDGDFESERFGSFGLGMAAARMFLKEAIAGVARVEMDSATTPFIGTAFSVGHNLFATASFVGDAIARQSSQSNSKEAVAWLDLSDMSGPKKPKLRILKVHPARPHWPVAFLEVEEEFAPLRLAPLSVYVTLADRPICVIGYPALDVRNDPEMLKQIFGNNWGFKQLMPGLIMGTEDQHQDQNVMIKHDASTSGVMAGAPLIDLETGTVVGIHYSGSYLATNFGVPAWETTPDPRWSLPSDRDDDISEVVPKFPWANGQKDILAFDEITKLTKTLMNGGVKSEGDLDVLFAGLPPEYLGFLPLAENVSDRLRLALVEMNRERTVFSGLLPLYYVVENAKLRRTWDQEYTTSFEPFLATIRQVQEALQTGST
jgi:hypothetical protein